MKRSCCLNYSIVNNDNERMVNNMEYYTVKSNTMYGTSEFFGTYKDCIKYMMHVARLFRGTIKADIVRKTHLRMELVDKYNVVRATATKKAGCELTWIRKGRNGNVIYIA